MQFENLPNELVLEVCKYLDAREVFRCFSDLNTRYGHFLQSSDHLQLTVSLFDHGEKGNYVHLVGHIRTLIMHRGINFELGMFSKVRHLILCSPQVKFIEQVSHSSLPHLEYLSITHNFWTSTLQSTIVRLYRKIFLNDLPHLQFCDLSEVSVAMPVEGWKQTFSLSILKVGSLSTLVYKAILLACPNLHFFEFQAFQSVDTSLTIVKHHNLKYLTIKDTAQSSPWDDESIRNYLDCVPNLQRLTIHRTNRFENLMKDVNYHWLALIVAETLQGLEQFHVVLQVRGSKRLTKCYRQNIFDAVKECVQRSHQNRYQIRVRFIQM